MDYRQYLITVRPVGNVCNMDCRYCCGHFGLIDTSGDVYSCREYANEAYKLGNILEQELSGIMGKNKDFGRRKQDVRRV